MKRIILLFCSFFYKGYWKLFLSKSSKISGSFFRATLKSRKGNTLAMTKCEVERVFIDVSGLNNELICTNGLLSDCVINITGTGNKLILQDGVKLRNANVIIRGTGCTIQIGKNTTFGGVRIINVGLNNDIIIGENCLFSDHIEVWASDTHPIYNAEEVLINKEKPVIIGNGVWVGSRVIILKGVKIEDGSIIGMGSVVTKNIPKNVVSAGYPNRTIKEDVYWKLDY